MSNIHGIHSGRQDDKKTPRDTEEFNVGGAQSSTAVQRPIRGSDGSLTSDLVNHARVAQQGEPLPASVEIVLYRNGFIVGKGAFRDLADPKNQAILASIKEGDVPMEIEKDLNAAGAAPDAEIGITLVNRTSEDYKPSFSFATSQGQSLSAPSDNTHAVSFSSLPARALQLPSGTPAVGAVMLVTHENQRIRLEVAAGTTVGQIYQHFRSITGLDTFTMTTAGFPPKPLTDPSVTVSEAKLINAAVQQRK